MKSKRFEDLEVWQLSRELVKSIYKLTSGTRFSKDFGLANQIQRSAVSIMSNIAEGFERKSKKEFISFLSIAKGSCGELRSQLYIGLDLSYINKSPGSGLELKGLLFVYSFFRLPCTI
jgi:four helix bundle protein